MGRSSKSKSSPPDKWPLSGTGASLRRDLAANEWRRKTRGSLINFVMIQFPGKEPFDASGA